MSLTPQRPTHRPTIDDDNLLAFAQWCRINRGAVVFDLRTLRRVFGAYAADAARKSDATLNV